jgi:hypothetical protein
LAAGTAFAASVGSAFADNSAHVIVLPSFPTDSGPGGQLVNFAGNCEASASGAGGLGSTGSGTARADYGFIRLTSSAYGALSTTAFGEFNDLITVNAPSLQVGTYVVVFYSVEVRGTMSAAAGPSLTDWTVRTDIGEAPVDMNNSGGFNGPGFSNAGPTGKGFGVYTASAQVQVGIPTMLHVEYSTNALAADTYGAPGSAVCDDMKCWWHGVTSVTSVNVPVTGWSITSHSGTDWSGPSHRCLADFGHQGGAGPGDGRLDNNDFIAFTDAFFAQNTAADVGSASGAYGSDGALDSNDFVAFITLFFQGC